MMKNKKLQNNMREIAFIENWKPESYTTDLKQPKALPKSTHHLNPRNRMNPKVWKMIIDKARDRSGNKCELCKQTYLRKNLHSHEMWKINFDDHYVVFYKIVVLCPMCHRNRSNSSSLHC